MEGFDQDRRGLFDGLQVPHSLNAIIIAAIGLFVYWVGIVGLEQALPSAIPGDPDRHCRVIAGMLGNASCRLGPLGAFLADVGGWSNSPTRYDPIVWILFFAWSSVVWAFFSGAVNRIAAMKLAREEGLELRDALRFGGKKFFPNLLSIVFVLGIIAFFYVVGNATIGGWVGRIPYVGDVLVGVLFFLVLLSSFLIVLATALGMLGFNLASSAIATEASDTFDGVSRAWNYILARPWQVLLTYVAIFAYLGLVIFFGNYFLKVSVKSMTVGDWGMGTSPRVMEVDDTFRTKLRDANNLPPGMRLQFVLIPGKGDYLYNRVIEDTYRPSQDKGRISYRQGLEYALERYKAEYDSYPNTLSELTKPLPETDDRFLTELPEDPWGRPLVYQVDSTVPEGYRLFSVGKDGKPGTRDDKGILAVEKMIGPRGPWLDIAPALAANGWGNFTVYALMFWVNLARVLLYAYVVAYFLSAQTMVYFLLRKDVEGDDYSEITLEDEPDDEAFEYAEPKSAPTGPAAAAKTESEPKKSLPMAGGGDAAEKKDEDKPSEA